MATTAEALITSFAQPLRGTACAFWNRQSHRQVCSHAVATTTTKAVGIPGRLARGPLLLLLLMDFIYDTVDGKKT